MALAEEATRLPPAEAAQAAAEAAQAAAEAAELALALANRRGIRVGELTAVAEHDTAVELLCAIWGADANELVNTSLLRALSHSGNYVAGAYAGDRLVGVAVAFFGVGHLHSHITGVDRTLIGGGVGLALKQHQRAWALARGLDRICWTFDPLLRRNAHFNLHSLGATATEYLVDFYGALADAVNVGDPSDRLYVDWKLDSPAAVAAARGERGSVDPDGAAAVVAVDGDEPVASPVTAGKITIAVPADAETLRAKDPALAGRWRTAVRAAFRAALADGYGIDGITRDGRYVLTRRPGRPRETDRD
jgi:predicted GNAT superfamily acetyltransferase